MTPLKIGIFGTGAVGGYYGGILASEGHDVRFVARAELAKVLNASGLRIESKQWQRAIGPERLQASADPSLLADLDGVLLCVKSDDTESSARAMRDVLAPHCWVMSLQNGVDNAARAQAVLQRPVIPAVVYVATAMPEPGLIRHYGRGDLVIGKPLDETFGRVSDEVLHEIATRFSESGVPVVVSANVHQALWSKLLVNCVFNPISALAQVNYGTLSSQPETQGVMQAVVEEVIQVARASGTMLERDAMRVACDQITTGMAGQKSSTAQDLARHKRTEIDHLNGFIVREGARLGVPTPVNATLYAMIKLMEFSLVPRTGVEPARP